MKIYSLKLTLTVIMLSMFSMISSVNATPHFAAKSEKKCSYCHNAWPQLNAKGRIYRERGYRFKADLKGPTESEAFPISALLQARPYDKKKNGSRKMRALQEVEIFIGGAVDENISTFFEVEAEDELAFVAELANMALSYRISDAVNFHATYAPAIWADSYGFIGSQFKLTRGKVGFVDTTYGGADNGGKLRSRRQNFEFSGRVGPVFYSTGISGEAGDLEGVQRSSYSGRVAFDITKDIMIGTFIEAGSTQDKPIDTSTTPDTPATLIRDYSRTGFDFQGDFGDSRLQAAFVQGMDQNSAVTSTDENNALSVQYYYTMKSATGSPSFVPIVRIDQYEKNNGADKYQELTLNLTYYIKENFRAFIEYWDQTDVPDNKVANDRTTVQFVVGF